MVTSGQHGESTGETHSKSGPGQGSVQQEDSTVSVAWSGDCGRGRKPEPHLQHGYQCSSHTALSVSHEDDYTDL